MIEININGKLYQVHGNPYFKGTLNLTHKMILEEHLPEEAERLKREAIELNRLYDAKQKQVKMERKPVRVKRGPRRGHRSM